MVGVEPTLGKMFFYMHFNCGWVENEMGVSNQIGKLNEDKKNGRINFWGQERKKSFVLNHNWNSPIPLLSSS
jgi:hypothetical protein